MRTPGYAAKLVLPDEKASTIYISAKSDFVGGRQCAIPQGEILGGGSSINAMMYTRASASDYDDWNMEGWSFGDLKPLFKKVGPGVE